MKTDRHRRSAARKHDPENPKTAEQIAGAKSALGSMIDSMRPLAKSKSESESSEPEQDDKNDKKKRKKRGKGKGESKPKTAEELQKEQAEKERKEKARPNSSYVKKIELVHFC